jgi:hypothetical protein
MAILRHEFGHDINVTVASFGSEELINQQAAREYDKAIKHINLRSCDCRRWSNYWLKMQCNRIFGTNFTPQYRELHDQLSLTDIALEIGGDNYSLDY